MIVCLCHGISCNEIRREAQRGANSLTLIQEACQAGGDCGQCKADVRRILRECRGPTRRTASRQG